MVCTTASQHRQAVVVVRGRRADAHCAVLAVENNLKTSDFSDGFDLVCECDPLETPGVRGIRSALPTMRVEWAPEA